jgi:large subunit ribosomal protein L25
MQKANLEVELRKQKGKNQVKKLKQNGLLPGVVYGENKDAIPVTVNPKQLQKLFRGSFGQNVIINLKIKDDAKATEENVIAYHFSNDALTQKMIHIDFLRLNMKKPIHTSIPLSFHGIAPGTKTGGVLIHKLDKLEIKCLPDDILDKIEIDVSKLDVGHEIKVKDLHLSKNIEILTHLESSIVRVEIPKKVDDESPLGPTVVAEPEEGEGAAAPGAEKKGAAAGDKKPAAGAAPAAGDKKAAAPGAEKKAEKK